MAAVRASDAVFRFGGDEFVVICEDVASEAALALGERIRRGIANKTEFAATGLTVSAGIATAAGNLAEYDALFELADRRLYQAKAAGRNCVIGDRPASAAFPSVKLALSV
jgi:diguanylate cyclase (GGDEF)-like protein